MAEEVPTTKASHREPLSVLWRALAMPQTLMALLGLVALAVALATLVPQIPAQARDDPQAWLAVQSGPLLSVNGLFRALLLYDIYHSFWYRLLLTLTGLTLFVWLVDSAELAWRATGRKPWPPTAFAQWGSRAGQVCVLSHLGTEETRGRLSDLLAADGYHLADVSGLSTPNLVAERHGRTLWSRPLLLAALLLALLSLAVVTTWGWQSPDWQPAPGDTWSVGHGTSLRLRLDSFAPQPGTSDSLCDYQSQMTWLEGNEPIGQSVISQGQPATLRGISVHQVDCVPAVRLRAWDKAGHPLALRTADGEVSLPGKVDIRFASPESQPLVFLPDKDLLISLSFAPLTANGQPLLGVTLMRNGGANPEPLGGLSASGSLAADDLRLDADLSYRPLLRVSHRPAMSLALTGLSLALLALAVAWLAPARLLWIAIAPYQDSAGPAAGSQVRLLVPAGTNHERWLPALANRLDEVLHDAA